MADVTDSKSVVGDNVWVRVPLPAPKKEKPVLWHGLFFLLKPAGVGLEGNVPVRGKNRPVNGFSVPRAGGDTAPVSPGVPLPAPKKKSLCSGTGFSFCPNQREWDLFGGDAMAYSLHFSTLLPIISLNSSSVMRLMPNSIACLFFAVPELGVFVIR